MTEDKTQSETDDDYISCDWCGKEITANAAITPEGTAEDYDFCVDCPADEAWKLEDSYTQQGVEKVEETLSGVRSTQYSEFAPGFQIKFFYQCLQKGIISGTPKKSSA